MSLVYFWLKIKLLLCLAALLKRFSLAFKTSRLVPSSLVASALFAPNKNAFFGKSAKTTIAFFRVKKNLILLLVNCLNLQTTGATQRLFDLYLNLLNLCISLPEDWNFNLEQFQVGGHSMNDQTIWLTKYFIHRKLAYKLTTVSNWQLFNTF